MTVLAASGPSALWYLTRGSGVVSLVLLTASVAIGVANTRRWSPRGWPRFVVDGLHRNLSLLVVVFILVHVLTSVIDGFAPIGLASVVLPFTSAYRPLWLGLGALAFDLILALTVTSLLRARLGFRAWRMVHWLAYASWPLALVHGLGAGSDTHGTWMLAICGVCLVTVWVAICARLSAAWPGRPRGRGWAVAALVVGPLLLAVWLPRGPLGSAWARRSGTPATVLAKARTSRSGSRAAPQATPTAVAGLPDTFTARIDGTVHESTDPSGLVSLVLDTRLAGGARGLLNVRIVGPPTADGGVSMQESRVTLGPSSDPTRYVGRIVSLQGTRLTASLASSGNRALRLDVSLQIDARAGTVSGRATGRPAGSSGATG